MKQPVSPLPDRLERSVNASRRRLKIAHVQLLPLLSGVQRVSLEELVRLDPHVFDRAVICREPGPLSEELEAVGIRCLFCPSLTRPISPTRDLAAYRHLTRLIRQHRFDIVHTHSSKTGILGRLAARAASVPAIVHTVHGFAFPAAKSRMVRRLYRQMERIGGRNCDALICLNESDRTIVKEELSVSEDRVHLIPNGVDITCFPSMDPNKRTSIRGQLGLPNDCVAVVMVGRLWEQKSPQTLVEAAARLVREGSTAHFIFIGDGELRASLEQSIVSQGVSAQVHLLGWRQDVPSLLPAFDIFALPSKWEGMPLAILEAMASQLPCIVSDIPGNRDLVEDGRTGYVFPLGNVDHLVERLRLLISDVKLRHVMGTTAAQRVARNYCIESRIASIQDLYVKLLTQNLAAHQLSHVLMPSVYQPRVPTFS